jgi:E3 ubiquitin-protein ligase NEDD4
VDVVIFRTSTRKDSSNYYRENDVVDETFTTTEKRLGKTVTVELKPGGADIPVTEANKKDYVDLVVEYRISKRVKDQLDALMSGFNELIPQEMISAFDERELGFLIGGTSAIDVYAFRSPVLDFRSPY